MTPQDLIDDLRSRINPAYAAQIGTESYERRLCAEALEAQADEIERLNDALEHAALVARNACEGWNDALMHEGARMAADAVLALKTPNV